MDKVAREACDPVYGFDAFKITSKRVSVNLVTKSSSGARIQDEYKFPVSSSEES